MKEKQKEFKSQTPDQDAVEASWEERHPNEDYVISGTVLPVPTAGPMEIMMEAVRRGRGKEELELLQGMFEFQKEMDAEEAKKLHFEAVSAFKAEAPPVKKDKWNKWLECWYTSLGCLLETYNPYLGRHGLSISFDITRQDDKTMTVECQLAHRSGHIESKSLTGPIDEGAVGRESGKKSRNNMQDLRSTFTYLRSTTLEAVLGVSGTEATTDDDGNRSGGKADEFITKDQAKDIEKRITTIFGDTADLFLTWLKDALTGTDTIDTIPAKHLKDVHKVLDKEEAKANKDESKLGE